MRLLVVCGQSELRDYLTSICRFFGYTVDICDSSHAVESGLPNGIILFDGQHGVGKPTEFQAVRSACADAEIIVITHGDLRADTDWRRLGASSVPTTPIMPGRLKFEIIRGRSTAA